MQIKGKFVLEKTIADMVDFLYMQDDIIKIDINSDLEHDYGSFSLSGLKIDSKGFIYPAAMGFDLGCGVGVFKMYGCYNKKVKEIQYSSKSPFGIRRKKSIVEVCERENCLSQFQSVMNKSYYGEIETGNHFLEIQKNDNNEYFLVVHSGLPQKLKEQLEIFFVDFYREYVKEDSYKNNGYIVKMPYNSENGKLFFDVCTLANKWAETNRKYIAIEVGKKIGCSVECFVDTTHEFLIRQQDVMIHSNGVQKLAGIDEQKVGIIISAKGCNNYLIRGKNDSMYINHGTKLRQLLPDGKRIYGNVEELMKNSDFSKKIEVIDILTPVLNCKKVGKKYEYTVLKK